MMRASTAARLIFATMTAAACAGAPPAADETPPRRLLAPDQAAALRAARSIRLVVEQKWTDADAVVLPFEAVAHRVFTDAGARVVEQTAPADATVTISGLGQSIAATYTGKQGGEFVSWSGAALGGKITLQIGGRPTPPVSFGARLAAAASVDAGQFAHPGDGPFPHIAFYAPGSFVSALLQIVGEVYGPGPLITALAHPEPGIRKNAAAALGAIGDRNAVERLVAAVSDPETDVQEQAAAALGRLRDRRAVTALIAAVKGANWRVQVRAAESLGAIGDARAVQPLIALLRKQPPEHSLARKAAAEALRKLTGEPYSH